MPVRGWRRVLLWSRWCLDSSQNPIMNWIFCGFFSLDFWLTQILHNFHSEIKHTENTENSALNRIKDTNTKLKNILYIFPSFQPVLWDFPGLRTSNRVNEHLISCKMWKNTRLSAHPDGAQQQTTNMYVSALFPQISVWVFRTLFAVLCVCFLLAPTSNKNPVEKLARESILIFFCVLRINVEAVFKGR